MVRHQEWGTQCSFPNFTRPVDHPSGSLIATGSEKVKKMLMDSAYLANKPISKTRDHNMARPIGERLLLAKMKIRKYLRSFSSWKSLINNKRKGDLI